MDRVFGELQKMTNEEIVDFLNSRKDVPLVTRWFIEPIEVKRNSADGKRTYWIRAIGAFDAESDELIGFVYRNYSSYPSWCRTKQPNHRWLAWRETSNPSREALQRKLDKTISKLVPGGNPELASWW